MPDDGAMVPFAADVGALVLPNNDVGAFVVQGIQNAVIEHILEHVPQAMQSLWRQVLQLMADHARENFPREIEKMRKRVFKQMQETTDEFFNPKRVKLTESEAMEIVSDFIPSTAMSVKMRGGLEVPRDSAQTVIPMQQHIKAVAKFQKHDVGHGSLNVTVNLAYLGVFNPFNPMNSELNTFVGATGHVEDFVRDGSSSFVVNKVASDPSVGLSRQWDSPEIMRRHKDAGIYDRFRVTSCKLMLKLTNVDGNNTIRFWYRFFHQGDNRVRQPFDTDFHGWPADAESLLGLKLVTAGSEVFSSSSRITVERLDSTPGMMVVTLGPNSSNGAPNEQFIEIIIPVAEIASSLSDIQDFQTETTTPLSETATPRPWETARLGFTGTLRADFQIPAVYFWGVEIEDGATSANNGQIKPIFGGDAGGSNLYIEGTAEYGIHLFSAESPAAVTRTNDMA